MEETGQLLSRSLPPWGNKTHRSYLLGKDKDKIKVKGKVYAIRGHEGSE
jgi:hypothetical protein